MNKERSRKCKRDTQNTTFISQKITTSTHIGLVDTFEAWDHLLQHYPQQIQIVL